MKGLKLRLPEVKSWGENWKSLGARPTVVPFQEVYMALKTGVAEAQENPAESIHSLKFYENQKYLIITEHVHSTAKYEISKIWRYIETGRATTGCQSHERCRNLCQRPVYGS